MNAMPLSAVELREAMRHARPFDAMRLCRILALDAQRGLLEVQAATPWTTIAGELRPGDARAAAVAQSLPGTVGESVARNTAGPDGQPAVAHVHSLTLVTPEGELRRLARHRDRELFSLAVGGYGVFGVFYSITLRIESLARAVENATAPQRMVLHPGQHVARSLKLLLPPERLERFIADIDALSSEWRVPLRYAEVRRTSAEDESFLRWASREFMEVKLAFSACEGLGARVRAAQLRCRLIDAAIAAGGRFDIGSTREATREQTDACYPQLKEFLAHKRRFDPHERLTNDWYRHQRRLVSGEHWEVRWAHDPAGAAFA